MKKIYTVIIVIVILFCNESIMAQEMQKNYINYQGVARNTANELIVSEAIDMHIALRFGAANATPVYEETHAITTDANGVFSLLIGNGNIVTGVYNTLPWGSGASYITVSLNGKEVGTTEMMAVPYALGSADNQWHTIGNDIENKNGGNVFVTGSLYASRDLSLAEGAAISEFSTDITLAGNSDEKVPTQKAIKAYVDSQLGGSGGTDNQNADEVPYDNTASGLTASDAQAAIDELASGGLVDTDNQEASEVPFDNTGTGLAAGDTQAAIEELASGGLVDTDDQNLSLSGTLLEITDGTGVDLSAIIPPGGTDDQNASEVPFDNTGTGLAAADTQAAIEELASGGLVDTDDQGLIMTGDVLSIEDGTGSVDLSDYVDVTGESGLLLGDGANISGLEGAADGQVAKWDGATNKWVAGTDEVGGGGGSSLWSENGSDIHFNSGNVGIGTNSPTAPLEIKTANGRPFLMESTSTNSYMQLPLVVLDIRGFGQAIMMLILGQRIPIQRVRYI